MGRTIARLAPVAALAALAAVTAFAWAAFTGSAPAVSPGTPGLMPDVFLSVPIGTGTHPALTPGQRLHSLTGAIAAGRTVTIDGRRYAAQPVTSCGHPRVVRDLDARLTWSYVDRAEARYLHIPRCSVVVTGHGHSVILTPSGEVATTS